MMECKEVQNLVTKYIADDLSDRELEQFLEHIETCKECYEELEINYTIFSALMQLDDNPNNSYDMNAMFLEELKASKKYMIRKKALDSVRKGLYVVSMMVLFIIIVIQITVWL